MIRRVFLVGAFAGLLSLAFGAGAARGPAPWHPAQQSTACFLGLYEHPDYEGRSYEIDDPEWIEWQFAERDLFALALDGRVQSIRVEGECFWVWLYPGQFLTEEGPTQRKERFASSDPDLTDNAILGISSSANVRVGSFALEPRERLYRGEDCRVAFYESVGFLGDAFITIPVHRTGPYSPAIEADFPTTAGIGSGFDYANIGSGDAIADDSLSSLRFIGNCFGAEVTLYEDAGLSGREETLRADDADLGDNRIRDNRASSFRVARR